MRRVLTMLLLTSCALRDVRPVGMSHALEPSNQARALVKRCAQAHGLGAWRDTQQVRLEYSDTWPNAVSRVLTSPLKDRITQVETTFLAGSGFTNETVFLDGHAAGDGAGADGDVFFALRAGERLSRRSGRYRIYGAGTQYLWELPFRMHTDTELLYYAGQTELDGRSVHRVLATWGSAEPSEEVDQYLLYIDATTHLLLRADFTVRARARTVVSSANYTDHHEHRGLLLPSTVRVRQLEPFAMHVHTLQLTQAHVRRGKR